MAKLNYNIHGDGEPLIVLHGLFGSARNWNTITKELSRDRQVITADLRNHGESEHTDTMTWADMVEDIHELMNELNLPSAALLGHSMGGKVAMAFALSLPEKTDALIVADIAPIKYEFSYTGFIDVMLSLPLRRLGSRAEAGELLEQGGITDAMIRQFLLQNLVRSGDGFAWRINLPTLRNYMDELAGFPADLPAACYEGPTRFLAAENSRYILPEHHAIITNLFPDASIQTIAGAGHWLHADRPGPFIETVQDFLKQATGTGEE